MVDKSKLQKTFFEVKAPLTSTVISLYALSSQALEGRIVRLDLTRSLRGKSVEIKLKVKAEGDSLVGEPIGLEVLGSYIRRMIRKGTDYVEDSFVAKCKDASILIKPFLITRRKVSRAVRKELRDAARTYLEGYLPLRTAKELFTELLGNKVQKELSLKLKKIYPLGLCEIRVFKIIEQKPALK